MSSSASSFRAPTPPPLPSMSELDAATIVAAHQDDVRACVAALQRWGMAAARPDAPCYAVHAGWLHAWRRFVDGQVQL